jgi:hypothetical protein
MAGEDPLPLFTDKSNEKYLLERMKEKFDMYRGACGLDVASINDECIRFAMQVLACKLLRKCCKDQVSTGVIATMEKCVEGVQMNWVTFLLNQFLMDCREAQGQGNIIPLCMVVNIDSISGLEGAKRHTVSVSYEQTMFGSEIC